MGFCNGNSGNPIFTETFGTGTTNNMLPAGTTNYAYTNGFPNDGFYTVSNGTFGNPFSWFQIPDHTPNDTNGKCLVINADFTPGEFYRTTVTGLCEATTYEFSAWLINITFANGFCSTQPGGTIPINVQFEIWDSTDTNLLASGNTGNIIETATPNWREYGLVFRTLTAQNTVILKMKNNGMGGCGNDLAIDDIEFKTCGDYITVNDSNNNSTTTLCSTQAPYTSILTATPDFSSYNTHFYQWQKSSDNGVTWNDLAGETNQSISVNVSNTAYYRAKVAEVAINLMNPKCVSFSNEFRITINQLPAMPTLACWESASINNLTCSWEISGTQPTRPATSCWETATFNTAICAWEVAGTKPIEPNTACWETTTFNNATCAWEVSGTQPVQPAISCWETATFNTAICAWEVTGTKPIEPNTSCWETATFNNTTCVWEVSGTQPVQPPTGCWEMAAFNITTCAWEVTGTKPIEPNTACWETATFNNTICAWEVTGSQPQKPMLECWQTANFNTITCSWEVTGTKPGGVITSNLELCTGDSTTLVAVTAIVNPSYIWNTGATTDNITIDAPGIYTVEISGNMCSFETKIFNVAKIEIPIIDTVISDGNDIIITTTNTGNFLYSLDGNVYQQSNIFYNVLGGIYNIYVKEPNCGIIGPLPFLHFYIPKFFTPNNDGFHDTFNLAGIEYYSSSEVSIFNRYGKLLKHTKNGTFSWNGTFRGEYLPTDDYWYVVIIEGQKLTGHVTLKR